MTTHISLMTGSVTGVTGHDRLAQMDTESIGDLLNVSLVILLIISFICIICDRFISDQTLYDQILLPTTDLPKPTYFVEPSPNVMKPLPFPSIFDAPELHVTFVIPVYNEESRLPRMLDEMVDYARLRQTNDALFTWEIIVVDDGSRDRTAELVIDYARQHDEVRLLRQPHNMGKGAAVQAGCLHSRGRLILMVDADGATKISEFAALETKLLNLLELDRRVVVVGSRAHIDNESTQNGVGMHFLNWLGRIRGINNSQCGFKLFSREAARWLFPNLHVARSGFDAELIVIAQKKSMQVVEVPVEWNEIEGSEMKISGMIKMALDILQIAIYHRVGIWSIKWKSEVPEEQ